MRAAFYERQGPAADVLRVGELPDPSPGPGEVLVRLATSGVNPSDVKARAGGGRKQPYPLIVPHSDGAGVIEAVGAGIDAGRVGDRVWTWNAQWKRPLGTAAELVALPARQARPLPDHVSFDEAACLGIPLLTALQAVRLARVAPGTVALVTGGAGAVAHYAIQIAKARGATVMATVSGDAKASLARDSGADHVVNYRNEDVSTRVAELTGGAGADAVIEVDLTGNAPSLPGAVRPHGTVAAYGMSSNEPTIPGRWLLQNNVDLRLMLVYELNEADRASGLAEVDRLLADRAIRHRIAAVVPLGEVVAAHRAVEEGALGNVIVSLHT